MATKREQTPGFALALGKAEHSMNGVNFMRSAVYSDAFETSVP
jgi:hypothetical protein